MSRVEPASARPRRTASQPVSPSISTDADLLIVGGGIAGLCAAYHAACAGRRVTIVDEGIHRASDLPIALVNPLRGRDGRLVAGGVDGMQATFALVDRLRADGHGIDGARGLLRPLIGVAPPALSHAFWQERIGAALAFDWHDVAPSSLGLVDPVPALCLRDAGWLGARSLLDALLAASAATRVIDRVVDLSSDGEGGGTALLASGPRLSARTVLWCGGAWGAAVLDEATSSAHDGLYKPGSLVAVDGLPLTAAMSFGLYAVPAGGLVVGDATTTVIGPTREGSQPRFPGTPVEPATLRQLERRVAALFGTARPAREAWRGVRLTRLSSAAATALAGIATITELDSRGFLMGPLRAAAWARSL